MTHNEINDLYRILETVATFLSDSGLYAIRRFSRRFRTADPTAAATAVTTDLGEPQDIVYCAAPNAPAARRERIPLLGAKPTNPARSPDDVNDPITDLSPALTS